MANQSSPTEFLLMGFSDDRDAQILHSVLFLFIYLTALVGNFLIITAVVLDHYLHSPMYFFLTNLSFLDICYITTTVPKSIAISLTNNKFISFAGCVTQIFLVVTFVGGELALLTIMAYDRYIAICHPLKYRLIMNWNVCIQMVAASWIINLIHAVLQTSFTFRLDFCGSNMIGQYFCDMPQLQKNSCSDTKVNQVLIFLIGLSVDSFCFTLIFASYGYIFSAVLKIPSVQGRYKAFSTCTPHLTIFSLFIITAVFSYMRPKALSSPSVDLVSAVLYTVLPPVLNPVIYSFRNKDIQAAVWKIPKKIKKSIA
ncbi:olfactory receptor 14A16-like [Rhineura floridana]|uniref:olfactory receptor 14A16-like n=1 Tax=Rhineura floridana TaxID=261503 RepID=UPI002AC82CB7|nr:olfactory receptor 14A16-like [Rhineura floridana]